MRSLSRFRRWPCGSGGGAARRSASGRGSSGSSPMTRWRSQRHLPSYSRPRDAARATHADELARPCTSTQVRSASGSTVRSRETSARGRDWSRCSRCSGSGLRSGGDSGPSVTAKEEERSLPPGWDRSECRAGLGGRQEPKKRCWLAVAPLSDGAAFRSAP